MLRSGGLFVLNEAIWKPGVAQDVAGEIHAAAVRAFGLFQTGERARAVDGWRELFGAAGFAVLADQRRYRRLDLAFREHGKLIEARLFVLRRLAPG